MPGLSREELLGQVRAALGRAAMPAPDPIDYEPARLAHADGALERFNEMAAQAGTIVHQSDGPETTARIVTELVEQVAAKLVTLEQRDFAGRDEIVSALTAAGVRVASETIDDDVLFSADVGITSVRWAIAETGSVVVAAGPESRRMISLAPPICIAIVDEEQILPDLLDWAQRQRPDNEAPVPSQQVLITGPSKTGDIELHPVIGMHGPEQVHVVLVRS